MLGGAGYGALMMKGAVRSRVDRVMGAADDAGDRLGDASSSVADAGRHTVAKAQGNPLAVGLMASPPSRRRPPALLRMSATTRPTPSTR